MESRTLRRSSLLLTAMLSGQTVDVLTGFITEEGDAMGRPVGVAIDARGALLVADDVGNTIWRVSTPSAPGS